MDVDREESRAAATTPPPLRFKKILPEGGNSSIDAHPTRVALIRTLCRCAASPPKWVRSVPRPYLVADRAETTYDPTRGEIVLTGYVRGGVSGAPWYISVPVHVPNLGTFAAKRVERATRKGAAAANASRGRWTGAE